MSDGSAAYFPYPLIGQFSDHGEHLTLTSWFVYLDPPEHVTVPVGFQTDFNSVPRGLWNFFPPWEYPEAGVVHDFLYRNPGTRTRAECDAIHRHIMEVSGAGWFLRRAAYLGLRAAGWRPWNRYRAAAGSAAAGAE